MLSSAITLPVGIAAVALVCGCVAAPKKEQSSGSLKQWVVPAATESQAAATLGMLKSLAGRWKVTAADGMEGQTEFVVTSAGSAVREIMFPGSDHEMVNMYHMDGACCIATHYCAGNTQPRMKACSRTGNTLVFLLDRASNVTSADTQVMGGLTFELRADGTVEQRWAAFSDAQTSKSMVFNLKRVE